VGIAFTGIRHIGGGKMNKKAAELLCEILRDLKWRLDDFDDPEFPRLNDEIIEDIGRLETMLESQEEV
jgi:hypothetical protein